MSKVFGTQGAGCEWPAQEHSMLDPRTHHCAHASRGPVARLLLPLSPESALEPQRDGPRQQNPALSARPKVERERPQLARIPPTPWHG